MAFTVRPPDTKRIPLSRDNWILVKKHLSAGEFRAMVRNYLYPGTADVDPTRVGMSKILTFVLDWSVTDPTLAICDKSEDERRAAFDAIDPEDTKEILRAVEKHEEEMKKEREEEKNGPATGSASSAT